MRKVIVIGSPGAGKSTFARKLRDVSRLPLYYLDLLWHKEDRTNVTKEEFDQELQEILTKDAWIIDGNYKRTLEKRLEECDTVFLDLSDEEAQHPDPKYSSGFQILPVPSHHFRQQGSWSIPRSYFSNKYS